MGYVFISYSSKNQKTADSFRSLLKKNSVGVWMAPYDIPAGSEYAEVLYDALTGCSCLLLLLTGDSQNSQWVKKEVNIAISNYKTVIPVKLENIELNSAMKLYLNDQQIVPVYTLDENSDGVRNVLKSIITIAGQFETEVTQIPNGDGVQTLELYGDSKFNGKGKFTEAFGAVYEGDFVGGRYNGKGKRTLPNGAVYEGDFVDGKSHGKGRYTWSNGDVYEGSFMDGKRTGKGKFVSAFETYEGDFVDGKYNGKGKCDYLLLKDTYEGDFVGGKPNGKGKYTSIGFVYEGDFVDGKYNGKGKRTFIDGSFYEGDFVDGKYNGYGKLVIIGVPVQQGFFKDGKFIG